MQTPSFQDLHLHASILRALDQEGYKEPTPIQAEAIPSVMRGVDVMATAQTGTGKTAAFALPILHGLASGDRNGARGIRVLVLTPTRELALQIDENFKAYGRHLKIRTAVILGGVGAGPQIQALRRNPDVLIATPGRLLDLMNQGHAKLGSVDTLVLDEADRMLDMGFIRDVKKIVNTCPRDRQTLLFSATLDREILKLSADMLRDPQRIEIAPPSSVTERIEQKVLFVEQKNKRALLTDVLRQKEIDRVLIFTRTKHRANRLKVQLSGEGILADAIHGNKTQKARQQALARFDRGSVRVLVATDIVARGIDVDGISHVINFEMPNDPESYVHRIGRTARAGAAGTALSFCGADEVSLLQGIQRLTRSILVPMVDHRFHSPSIEAMLSSVRPSSGGGGSSRGGGSARSGGNRSRSGGGGGGRSGGRSRSKDKKQSEPIVEYVTGSGAAAKFGRRRRTN